MAADDDRRRREDKRAKEDEEDSSWNRKKSPPGGPSKRGDDAPINQGDGGTEKVDELIKRAEPLIQQLNNLYAMYVAGVEKRPPIERRSQLDQIMVTLQLMSKPTPAYQFRYQTLLQSYVTHKERWEKMLDRITRVNRSSS